MKRFLIFFFINPVQEVKNPNSMCTLIHRLTQVWGKKPFLFKITIIIQKLKLKYALFCYIRY